MNVQELRIGNKVLFDNYACSVGGIRRDFNDEPYTIEIEFPGGMFSEVGIEEIKPILITDEWIENFRAYEDCGNLYISSPNSRRRLIIYKMADKYFTIQDIEIKTVHQLQNIFFALTGNELAVK